MNLNEEVSGTNHDEVSRLQTPSPQFRSTPLPQIFTKTISNLVSNYCRICRVLVIASLSIIRNTLNILCISRVSMNVSESKR